MNNVTAIRPDNNDVVILELDRPRELRLGHKALKRFSALTGSSMAEMQEDIQNYEKMSALVYVMLSQDDPSLTPDAVDDLIDQAERRRENRLHPADVMKAVSAAVFAAFADENGGQEENQGEQGETPPQAAGTGEKA